MNRSMVMGMMLGAIAMTAAGAYAGYRYVAGPSTVPVLSVRALSKTMRAPRQECHDEQVTKTRDPKDQHRLAGTGIGAVVGGLLGHGIGGGSGKALATVAGAAAGGYAGNQIEGKMQQGNTYTTTEQRCETVYDTNVTPNGYEVVYEMNGERHKVHLSHDPGKSLPLKDGQVVLE